MLVPKPPVELEDHCSIVHDNTLYTYSAKGFASIPLQRNGTWTKLHMGEPVSNAACVKASVDGDPHHQALYVVGGSTSESDPSGLQRYSFQDKKWRSIQSARTNMANRTHHRVVALEASNSILVYGGHQDDASVGSSDTFVIQTTAPYGVLAFTSQGAPPSVSPVLVPWNDRQAALIGGDTTPKGVHLFEPKGGWQKSPVTLADPLPDNVQCAIIHGTDGSKVLEVFDLSVAPNTVTSLALVRSDGKPGRPAQTIGQPAKKDRRDGSLKDFPPYDDELASSTRREQYSLAQGDDGLVVFSSGGGSESLSIFNQTANGWLNATRLFYGDKTSQQILSTMTSESPTPTATQSSEPSESSAAGGDAPSKEDGGGSNVGTIVGATLGSILGVAAILLILLFVLKRKKDARKRAAGGQGGAADKDRLSFQDQGVEPLTRSAYPMAQGPAPLAASSVDSLAIFSGKFGDEKSPRPAAGRPSLQQNRQPPMKSSPLATMATAPPAEEKSRDAQAAAQAGQPGDRRTEEGWARYFQDNDAASLVDAPPPQAPKPMNPASDDNRQSTWPTASLTPLNFGFLEGPKPLGRVPTGSPTTEHPSGNHIAIPESQSARISSADSISLASDDYDQDRDRDSHWPQRSWAPRPASSAYTASVYNPSSSNLPSTAAPSVSDYRRHDSVRASTNTRGSSVVIPDTLEPLPTRNQQNSDMSWLNLNAQR